MNKPPLPEEIGKLIQVFRDKLNAEVEVEYIPSSRRYRLAVVSSQFHGMPHLKRQDLMWDIVDRMLSPEQSMNISIILAYDPQELEPAAIQSSLY